VLGLFLARSGHDVSLLGRPWHMDVIRKKGLIVTGIWGDYASKAFDLYTSASDAAARGTAFGLIILTVKSYDTARAVDEIVPLMRPATTLLSLQNGLGNAETILARIPAEQVLVSRLIFGVEVEPGLARVTVQSDPVAIGPAPACPAGRPGGVKPLLSPIELAHVFSKAKIPAIAVGDILPVLWAKVVYNCALNGICSLEEMPYGKILEREDTREAMRRVVRECYAVAAAKSVRLEPASADEYVRLLEGRLIPQTAAHYPSMLQDLRKGKRTDIAALNGAISRMGREAGVPTPENDRILVKISQKEHTKIHQV